MQVYVALYRVYLGRLLLPINTPPLAPYASVRCTWGGNSFLYIADVITPLLIFLDLL